MHGYGKLKRNDLLIYEGYFRGNRPYLLGRIPFGDDHFFIGDPDSLQ